MRWELITNAKIWIGNIPDEKRLESSPPPEWWPPFIALVLLLLLGKKLRLKRLGGVVEELPTEALLLICGSCISPWSVEDLLVCINPCGGWFSSWFGTCDCMNIDCEGCILRLDDGLGWNCGLMRLSSCGPGRLLLPRRSMSWWVLAIGWWFIWWWWWSCCVDIWERPNRCEPMLFREGGLRFLALSWASASQKALCVIKLSRLWKRNTYTRHFNSHGVRSCYIYALHLEEIAKTISRSHWSCKNIINISWVTKWA